MATYSRENKHKQQHPQVIGGRTLRRKCRKANNPHSARQRLHQKLGY